MPQVLVRQKTPKANISLGIDTVTTTNAIPEANIYIGKETITLRKRVPQIIVYDSVLIEPLPPYIDAGLYNQEGPIADAGFYNTSSWEIVWDGGNP